MLTRIAIRLGFLCLMTGGRYLSSALKGALLASHHHIATARVTPSLIHRSIEYPLPMLYASRRFNKAID